MEEKRWLLDCTKEEYRKRPGVHRTTFRHRSRGHDLLWPWSNPQDNSFLVPVNGTASSNGVEERLTYTSTTANDKAGRPPSYQHRDWLTFPQIICNQVFIQPFIGRSTNTNPPCKRCKSRLLPASDSQVWEDQFFGALCWFVLIDRVEVCTTEKGYRYRVSFAARNESELEGRVSLCSQKQKLTRDPPLGSCTCRARATVPIPV